MSKERKTSRLGEKKITKKKNTKKNNKKTARTISGLEQGDKTPFKSLVLSSAPSDELFKLFNGADSLTQCLKLNLCKKQG
jgi:hypothetical protein